MEQKYEALTLKNQLCFPIYLCSKEIVRRYTPILDKLNLTYTQYVLMMYFWEVRKSNVKALSKTTLLDPSTLTPLLRKLEKKGYIRTGHSEADARYVDVEVTDKGLKLRDSAINIPGQMGKCINLSDEEAKVLYKLMYKVLLNTQKKEEK